MTGEEKQEARFLIDGKEYPIPDVNTFTLDEDELLWDYAGLAREDFVRVDQRADDAEELEAQRRQKLKHPGLMRTLLHVAYQRGNPTVKTVVIKRLVGQTTIGDAMSRIMEAEPEDDDGPPDQSVTTSEPNASSRSKQTVTDDTTKPSPETSGNGSTTDSDAPAETPEPTGTGRSDTSSPASIPAT